MDEIEDALRQFNRTNIRSPEEGENLRLRLEELRLGAVERGEQEEAKLIWCYKTISKIQDRYIKAFHQMKENKFYDAWCTLERIELAVHSLDRHFKPDNDPYRVEHIYKHVKQFQSLYPYRLFMSPAFLAVDKRCSTCDRPISAINPCGHVVGEIYDGEICCRVIHEAKLIELSVVTNPVNKYAVSFSVNPETSETEDNHNYTLVGYVAAGLRNPFDAWELSWTQKRQPHSRYRDVGRNAPCPCKSGKKYKACCLREDGVLQPHAQIRFSIPPPPELPEFGYVDDIRHLELSSGVKLGKGVLTESLRPKVELN